MAKWRLYFESAWWAFVLIVLTAVLLPIYIKVPDYPFWIGNILFIVTFLMAFRWLFLLKYSLFATNKWVKLMIMFLCMPYMILLFDHFTDFQSYIDDYGLQSFMHHLTFEEYKALSPFIRFEMLFFGVGSLISIVLLAFRMIISIWLFRNRGRI